jgi:hypothetical protein
MRHASKRPEKTVEPSARVTFRLSEIAAMHGLSLRFLFALQASGRLPPPDLEIGERVKRWKPETILSAFGPAKTARK